MKKEEKEQKEQPKLELKTNFKGKYEYLYYTKEIYILFFVLLVPLWNMNKIGMFLGIFAIYHMIIFFTMNLTKKRYSKRKYCFYQDHFVYLLKEEKDQKVEINYQYITHITKKQKLLQKIFKIGNIELTVSVPNEMTMQYLIYSIEQPEQMEEKIKKLVGISESRKDTNEKR